MSNRMWVVGCGIILCTFVAKSETSTNTPATNLFGITGFNLTNPSVPIVAPTLKSDSISTDAVPANASSILTTSTIHIIHIGPGAKVDSPSTPSFPAYTSPPAPTISLGAKSSTPMYRRPDVGDNLVVLLGKAAAFSAEARFAGSPADAPSVPCAFRDGNARTESGFDLRNSVRHPIIVISRPDEDCALWLYPFGKRYYLAESTDGSGQTNVFNKVRIGSETVDGHPCIKYSVTVQKGNGYKQSAFVWEATDLNNAPIRIDLGKQLIHFTKIIPTPPGASLFEISPPAGYKQCFSAASLTAP